MNLYRCMTMVNIASVMDKGELLSVIGVMIDDYASRNNLTPASLINELAKASKKINEDLGPMHTMDTQTPT